MKSSSPLRCGVYPTHTVSIVIFNFPSSSLLFLTGSPLDWVARTYVLCLHLRLLLSRYEGEWKDDMKWGFGTAVYLRKAHYEGHFFMDKRHGFGKMRYSNAGTYEVSQSVPQITSSNAERPGLLTTLLLCLRHVTKFRYHSSCSVAYMKLCGLRGILCPSVLRVRVVPKHFVMMVTRVLTMYLAK